VLPAVHASQGELAAIAAVLTVVCIAGSVLARRRVPAVSIGLAGGLITGLIAFVISSADGRRGVPQDVVVWASIGLVLYGLVALFVLPAPAPAASWRRFGAVIVLCAPLLGLVTVSALQHACPLYVGRGSGFCFYYADVLGGWTAGAAIALSIDLLFVAFLIGVSAVRYRRSSSDLPHREATSIAGKRRPA